MSYIFSSNGNNYTFKKLDNMLINMPERDGHHVLIRETVDGVPQYSWGSASCIVKVNEAFVFEYTPEATESFNGEWGGDGMPPMPSGSYLVTTNVITYLPDNGGSSTSPGGGHASPTTCSTIATQSNRWLKRVIEC